MNLSDIRYERFSKKDYYTASELLSQDAEAGADLLQVLDEEPETFICAFIDDTLVALAQMEAPTHQSHLNVFVAPRFRRRGIGAAMVLAAETQLQAGGTRAVSTSFRSLVPASPGFARKLGYAPYYSLVYMQRTGGFFSQEEVPVRLYTDEDFLPAHSLYATAFHEMRVRIGRFPDSVVAQPNEGRRNAWKADAEDRFVYEINGEIAAYSHLHGNEISSVSVRSDLQGRGIGRKFVKYLCNEIYQRGHSAVILCCVAGNEARQLYDSLGFQETHIMEYMRKTLEVSESKM